MLLTPEQRDWLLERRDELHQELQGLRKADSGLADPTERQAELLLEIERINDQLGEPDDTHESERPERREIRTD